MHRLAALPSSVQSYLRDFVTRWRWLLLLRALGAAMALLSIWLIIAGAADRALHLSSGVRLFLLIAAGVVALGVALFKLRRLAAEVDWVAIAGLIEQQDPRFDQSLVTVTSRLLGEPEHRGSDEILSHLLREVEQRAAERRQHKLLQFRAAAGPWLIFAIALTGILILGRVPELGGARLLARLVEPLADIPPVTTTELRVTPGDADVMQSESFRVDVAAQRLGNNPVLLYITDDGANWTRYPMDDAGGGRFSYTLSAVGRDLRYYVAGGDATTRQFAVRVKRPPAVAEFRIRYTYPAYTRRPPFTVTNTDGTIEAPVGSDAVLTIVATEPLQSALLTISGQKMLMERTRPEEPNVRQANLRVQSDASYDLDLISTREVRGGVNKMLVRATADHPPLVRLLQAGQTLRLNPRDILPLTYEAMDDYGLEAVAILGQLNAEAAVRLPLPLTGDRRRQDETVNFDLASMRLKVGDVLSLTVAARDTASQETTADELRILISPRSIDLDARERIDELTSAAGYARTLGDELEAAGRAMSDAEGQKDRQSPPYLAAAARASRHLTSASESATLLRQALLRSVAHSDGVELSVALCDWIDLAHQQAENADEIFHQGGGPEGIGAGLRQRVQKQIEPARQLFNQVQAVAQGERAAAVLADREDFKACSAAHPPADSQAADRLEKTLARVREEIDASAKGIGVNASAADADNQLLARIAAAKTIVRSRQAIDFASLAREWSQALQRDGHRRTGFDKRLGAAAQAEAVRKDADLEYARDLELAARAAGAIENGINQIPAGRPIPPGQLNGVASAMAALQREHAMASQPAGGHSADELRVARGVAAKAREELARWSGEAREQKSGVAARPGELESLAMRAGAEAARREYKRVAEADKALAQKLTDSVSKPGGRALSGDASPAAAQLVDDRVHRIARTAEKVAIHMAAAETVDRIGQSEEKLAQEEKNVKNGNRDLAGRQRAVADQIADVERQQESAGFPSAGGATKEMDDPNWRGRATAALLFAQEELAAIPQELASMQDLARRQRKAVERAAKARQEADHADAERRPMLTRAAEQAEHDAEDASTQLDQSIKPVSPEAATDLADRLEPFSPEATAARKAVAGPLLAALTALQTAAHNGSADAVSRSGADALKAIDVAQKELIHAQDAFTERDPLVAAKWFARAAADSLAHHPHDLRTALLHQNNVSLALSRAWNRSIHRAAELRLSELPSMQAVYLPPAPAPRETATVTALSPNTGSRDWARLHAREGDDLTATLHDPDPPGYEEPLRLYFEAMGKARQELK